MGTQTRQAPTMVQFIQAVPTPGDMRTPRKIMDTIQLMAFRTPLASVSGVRVSITKPSLSTGSAVII